MIIQEEHPFLWSRGFDFLVQEPTLDGITAA